ncbi:hypothetical protein TIFTF001_028545 [Ficus carica]|uniref:Uncharacterized protein n=1 Tax=Ficus carica TaxID=3494 RepID=A0AA88J1A7_FICCA|nr:hypothetical protein TIFTF001_028545 [Ficus carica]
MNPWLSPSPLSNTSLIHRHSTFSEHRAGDRRASLNYAKDLSISPSIDDCGVLTYRGSRQFLI